MIFQLFYDIGNEGCFQKSSKYVIDQFGLKSHQKKCYLIQGQVTFENILIHMNNGIFYREQRLKVLKEALLLFSLLLLALSKKCSKWNKNCTRAHEMC